MRSIGWLLGAALLVAGCKKAPGTYDYGTNPERGDAGWGQGSPQAPEGGSPGGEAPVTSTPGSGTEPTPASGTPGDAQAGAQARSPAAALQALRDKGAQLEAAPQLGFGELVAAVRAMAYAVQALPEATAEIRDTAGRIASYADRLEAGGESAAMQARWVKRAFAEATSALTAYDDAQAPEGLKALLAPIRAQVAELRDDLPCAEQKDAIARLYGSVAAGIEAALAPSREPTRGTK